MGIGRFVKHLLLPGTYAIDLIKNSVDEDSMIEGAKKTIKQELTEDNPLTKAIYDAGKYDGTKDGYVNASKEYERKLLNQANHFLEQKKVFEYEKQEYENLLDEYEKEIEELNRKVNKTNEEKEYLTQLLIVERKLKGMAC